MSYKVKVSVPQTNERNSMNTSGLYNNSTSSVYNNNTTLHSSMLSRNYYANDDSTDHSLR